MTTHNNDINLTGNFSQTGSGSTNADIIFDSKNSSSASLLTVKGDGSISLKNYSLPLADGTSNQVLSTDGSGVTSFNNPKDLTRAARSTLSISSNTITSTLDGSSYTVVLSSDIIIWNVPLPVGGDAANYEYGCRIDFNPPVAGGSFTVAIPAAWKQLGTLDIISLASTDFPIVVILTTFADGTIGFTFQQAIL